jgi:hypothetical protein
VQVVSKLYQSGKVNLSDIGHCANNDPACSETVRGIMDNMVGHSHKPFVQFLNNIMLYVCDKATYANELAVRLAASTAGAGGLAWMLCVACCAVHGGGMPASSWWLWVSLMRAVHRWNGRRT